jgi:tRNA-(ms[2]io[6]A)-hydroxylase
MDWVEQALKDLEEILIDHAHCERKAAGVALNLLCRYPSSRPLIHALPAIAREELEHFEQVNALLEARGIALRPLTPPPYGAALKQWVRSAEPHRFLDSLLMAALIEARSHERLSLLGQHCPDPELADFYQSLKASEARHYGVYWLLATQEFDRREVEERLEILATAEADILATRYPYARIHS